MKKISTLLIIAGILIILYPTAIRAYDDYQTNKLLASFEQEIISLESLDDNSVLNLNYEDDYKALLEEQALLNNTGSQTPPDTTAENESPAIATEPAPTSATVKPKTDTFIKIPAIELFMPILLGVSDKNLRYAAASFDNGVVPGAPGNYALAGHRSYTYGRMFNRLNELAPGHLIEISVKAEKFTYRIIETLVVNPEDTWVLKSDKTKNTITLVTCTPIRTATQRLIIKGELMPQ